MARIARTAQIADVARAMLRASQVKAVFALDSVSDRRTAKGFEGMWFGGQSFASITVIVRILATAIGSTLPNCLRQNPVTHQNAHTPETQKPETKAPTSFSSYLRDVWMEAVAKKTPTPAL